ncbi:hypothetical protein UA08_03957 [Talaromyces atroroseus]|uniref:Phosphatidylethanolamine-binding protein n=1 Tax=Talaromyces atroroseus TaxID=1441469 RepID=A0A1Q5Q972_TALAT|nr:hypothetical protein UA08_03957 [Talaromyces atroroseus]OKL60677.1 hypothetical protein UA08_03957 [Talaromyces atroroseus]
MLMRTILTLLLAAGIAHCQTPPGFEPSTENKLGVKFGNRVRADNGNKLEKADTQSIPRLDLKFLIDDVDSSFLFAETSTSSSHYIVFMIDLDVPRNGTTVPFLHWYQPNFGLNRKTGKLLPPKSSEPAKAEYVGPSPPPGPAHRYVELLFNQPFYYEFPEEFDRYLEKKSSARVGFEINDFVKAAKLQKPIAGNWFLVQETEDLREDL